MKYSDLAEKASNLIQFNTSGEIAGFCGSFASELLLCPDFKLTPFTYQVWEVMNYTINTPPVAILRANQSTVDGALSYMKHGRVLVYNRQAENAARVRKCPQCRANMIQTNLGDGKADDYCEECGWPDENRGDN